ncbi:ribosome-associated translation inhibitor RaiA [Roseomonas frigidaquae]|uniref:Ribosome hibernation promoting factor n=1 Tax=Falsiroseomonas frigidaquae TaxID=487318 RepID=A0ABX1F7K2_9PROT|nr:ribosome-associated translation inhibitor RaiA [Falsiroseomonas frigidaquae]NKE48211.1 ribosome-associated translation inhibitor RaiA [Falsiroseomonas frigidaquae]
MHITVAGKQVETGEALKTHVRDGLTTISRKYFDHAVEANVTFSRDAKGHAFLCDINLKAGRNLFLRGEGEGADAHRAFTVAAEHVAKRLRRYRRRMNDHARSLAAEREPEVAEVARQVVLRQEEDEETPDPALEEAGDNPAVVAETPAEIHRLTVGEAVMRMDLAHVPVLMFRNRATNGLNVVYRRGDGNIGWIDPKTA